MKNSHPQASLPQISARTLAYFHRATDEPTSAPPLKQSRGIAPCFLHPKYALTQRETQGEGEGATKARMEIQRGHRATLTPAPTNSCSSLPVCMMRAGRSPFSGGSFPLGCPQTWLDPRAGPLARLSHLWPHNALNCGKPDITAELQSTGIEWFYSSHKDVSVFLPQAKAVAKGPCSGGRATTPAEPSQPTGSSPRLGSAPLQPWLSIRPAGHKEWAAGSILQAWALPLSHTHGLASARPAQGSNRAPRALHRKQHSHSEMPTPNRDRVCYRHRLNAAVKGEFPLIISTFHQDDSGALPKAAGAPQAERAGGTPVFQVLQVMNTLPFQDLGWAKDTLSFIKTISEVTDHFGWASWCFWEMQIYIKVIK